MADLVPFLSMSKSQLTPLTATACATSGVSRHSQCLASRFYIVIDIMDGEADAPTTYTSSRLWHD